MFAFVYQTKISPLLLIEDKETLCGLYFNSVMPSGCEQRETNFLKKVEKELSEYFSGKRKFFDIPLSIKGTAFQKEVWNALQTIPYGETRSYKDIANQIGCYNGFRAVGMANHNNPISIIIPCHRVISASGKLTGYAGGIDIKEKLIKLERNFYRK